MIIKAKTRLSILPSDSEQEYSVLPLNTGVLFPGVILTVQVSRPQNIEVIRQHRKCSRPFVSSYAHTEVETPIESPIHQVGVLTDIRDVKEDPSGSLLVTLEGIKRMALRRIVVTEPYVVAVADEIETPAWVMKTISAKVDKVIAVAAEVTHLDPMYSPEIPNVLKLSAGDPSLLADRVAATFHFSLAAKQELLETVGLRARYDRLLYYLNGELNRVATALSISEKVKRQIKEDQHRYFLKQQLYEIRRQLGEDTTEDREAARFRSIIEDSPQIPAEVVARARIEIDRLSQLSPASAEYGVTKSYLEIVLNLPWGKRSSESVDMLEAGKTLSTEYYGPVNLKEQILHRLSVRKASSGADEGPTLCLVGAPGTGKASLAKAIARALSREFIRISVGGITEISEIKGTARTFLGAYPGRIVRALREVTTCDPVVLIEDIDYFNIDNKASINMALMEVIDTRRNSRFLDSYVGIPIDLSKVFFICSVRSYEEIPEQFIPRLELIEIPGYIEREKIVIARRYIIPKLLKKQGLLKSEFKISDKVLAKIISHYTRESGLLGFSQQIEKISRKIGLEKAKKQKSSWTISEKNLTSYLGGALFIPEEAETEPEIGIATGLAWTGSGGELMFIEGLKMKGEGQIITTGSLGDVMRESVQAAHSYVRAKADMLGIDFNDFNDFDVHIHFPSGAIPKDGPSAGATVSLVIASVMSERPIRNDIAITGEVTLRGRVLSVGGVKEKISAAYRAGIHSVALPKGNMKDVRELPREIQRKTKFHYVERVDEIFELCLLNFTPSTFTLEKIFAEEIEKVKGKKGKRTRKVRSTSDNPGKKVGSGKRGDKRRDRKPD
jgi:ATP-dependent Lon protease